MRSHAVVTSFGPHLVSGQPSSIHVRRTRIAIRVPFQTNLGSTSSKCSQFYSSSIQRTTFSIWATELDSCSPYSNSNSSTISNQPRFNELEMQSILFELDSTISCSIKKTSSTNSICSYRPQLFLSSSVCHVFYRARFASHSIGFILSSIWHRARFNLHSANER